MSSYTNSRVQNVSQPFPCVICGKPDWCWFSEDGAVAGCKRSIDPKFPYREKIDSIGITHYIHWLKGTPGDPVPESYFKLQEPKGDRERADITTVHAAYSELLEMLRLDDEDKRDLHTRGYSDEEIETIGFKSWPSADKFRAHVLTNLHGRYGNDLLSVPGFRFEGKKAAEDLSFTPDGAAIFEEPELEMVGGPGYFLPVTDEEGRIAALQIRLREGSSRYIGFSCPHGGAGAGLHVHVPKGYEMKDKSIVVAEGSHKANIASKRLGRLVIGLPSIAMIDLALPLFGQLGAKTVELAYDADVRDKPTTAGPLRRAAHRLAGQGYDVRVWTWPSARGKGLDDVLTSPDFALDTNEKDGEKAIKVLQGRAIWNWIKDVCRMANLPADPIQDAQIQARARIYGLIENVTSDNSIAFRSENIEAVAALEKNSAESISILDKFKEALEGKFTAWSEKLGEAQSLLSKKKRIIKAQQNGKQIFKTGSHTEIGTRILASLAVDSTGKHDPKYAKYANGSLHVYDHEAGIWRPHEPSKLRTMVQDWDQSPIISTGKNFKADIGPISGAIKCAIDRAEDKSFFSKAARGLAFKNGFLRVTENDELVLERHSSEHRALVSYDFDYDPNMADPTEWLGGFHSVWNGDDDVVDKIKYTQEFHGTMLMGDCPKQKYITIFWGPKGSNGKSSVIAGMQTTLPEGSTCAIKPADFTDKFRLAEIAGKLGNFVDELPGRALLDAETIKHIATAKNEIQVERKNQDPFWIKPMAGHLWGCNTLPTGDDMDEAFFARFRILQFHNQFKEEKEVKDLWEKIAKREMAAIVNWAIRGYARLLAKARRYTTPASCAAALDKWKMDSNPASRFIEDCLDVVSEDEAKKNTKGLLTLASVYLLFSKWEKDESGGQVRIPMKRNTLGKRLSDLGYAHRDKDGNRMYRLRARDLDEDSMTEEVNKPRNSLRARVVPDDEDGVFLAPLNRDDLPISEFGMPYAEFVRTYQVENDIVPMIEEDGKYLPIPRAVH